MPWQVHASGDIRLQWDLVSRGTGTGKPLHSSRSMCSGVIGHGYRVGSTVDGMVILVGQVKLNESRWCWVTVEGSGAPYKALGPVI